MKNPLIIMSAITGKPTRDKIQEYLTSLFDNGIRQVLLYPRAGCEIEYLSEEWFLTIGNFIEIADQLNMCIWLYDDFNWPSGDAGGRVTKIEEYRLKAISIARGSFGQVSAKSQHNSSLFGEKFFPNLLSSDCVDYFIKCTHEEYYKRFGKYFGTVIKGIFTDEPSIGYCCSEDSIPYYEGAVEDYKKEFKRDFFEDIRSEYNNFYPCFVELISRRFKECYIDKLNSWCKNHNILMTGHLMCDDDPVHATKHGGNYLENLSSFLLPGIDEISTQLDGRNEMSLFGAIEYASGTNGAMAELFALGPCDMSYAKKRCMLYLCACHKIDKYFLAISHLDIRGNLKVTDFFNNFCDDQPNFGGMRLLSKEAEIASFYAKKDYTPQIYIRYPFSKCARLISKCIYSDKFFKLLNDLTYNQIQWKLIGNESVDAPVIELDDMLVPNLTIDEIIQLIGKKPIVVDENGDTPRGIFVRCFNDGSIIILNLFAPSDYYYVNGKRTYLELHQVLLSNKEEAYKVRALHCEFNVAYHNPNIVRLMYLNENQASTINCLQDIDTTFILRKGQGACLNNQEIPVNSCTLLPRGMKELYTQSMNTLLKKGAHTIYSQNDFKYMPSVFVAGDFSALIENDSLTLDKRKTSYHSGEIIYDYGKISFSIEVLVPKDACGIEIKGTTQYTKVYLNNTLIGEGIAYPFIFKFDKEMCGKVALLKIEQYSSIAPIFADVDYWDKNVKESQWRGTPSTTKEYFGFEKIYWLF